MFNVQSSPQFNIGTQYRITLRQRAAASKNAFVAAEFPTMSAEGKVKTKAYGSDGKVYMSVKLVGFDGLFIFRIDANVPTVASGINKVDATLFLVL